MFCFCRVRVILLVGFDVSEGESIRVEDEMVVEDASVSVVSFEMGVKCGGSVLIIGECFVEAVD